MTPRRCTIAPEGAAALAAAEHQASVPVLQTARLCLRAPRVADLPVWTGIYTSADAAGFGGPFTEGQAWEEFAYYAGGWMLYGHGLWAVERLEDGACIGFVHLGLEWDDDEPELGWMFAAEHRGQGYASEAADAALRFGRTLLPTFVSYVDPSNDASNALAERLGAVRDSAAEARIEDTEGAAIHVWRHGVAA